MFEEGLYLLYMDSGAILRLGLRDTDGKDAGIPYGKILCPSLPEWGQLPETIV